MSDGEPAAQTVNRRPEPANVIGSSYVTSTRKKNRAIPMPPTPMSHKFHRHIILGRGSVL